MKFYGIDQKFIKYLKEFYNTFEYYADVNQVKTDTFKWDGGLLQGCPLSPFLFALSLNYILVYLDNQYKTNNGYYLVRNNNISQGHIHLEIQDRNNGQWRYIKKI